jgi:hypothetical protein
MKRHHTILAISLAGSLFGTGAQAALIGHWAFDEGTGTTAGDSSPGGNNGAILGGATWASDATRATYISFDGEDDAVDPSLFLAPFNAGSDFTWAAWANRGAASTVNEVILGNRYNGVGTVDFAPRQFIKLTPTQFEWHQNGNGNDNLNIDDLAVGEWHHHAIVKTGTTIDYYLDGVFSSSRVLNEAIGTESLPFFIGGNPGAPGGEFFNGGIDDVRIYDNALSAAEIAALIPEPSSALLGACGLLFMLRRRR